MRMTNKRMRLMAAWPLACLTIFLAGKVSALIKQGGQPRQHEGAWPPQRSTGFYVHPLEQPRAGLLGRWGTYARLAGTDKGSFHTTYRSHFELPVGHSRVHKMLEIGLGCDMHYGPGRSAKLWREYFPLADVWFAEVDGACVEKHKKELQDMNIKVVVGDQASPRVIREWINQTDAITQPFDLIVDDGSHGNLGIYVTFTMLFHQALKPGGMYVIEDLYVSRSAQYQGGPDNSKVVMLDVLRDWLEAIITLHTTSLPQKEGISYKLRYKMPPGMKSIECSLRACTIIKCYTDDDQCGNPLNEDAQLGQGVYTDIKVEP